MVSRKEINDLVVCIVGLGYVGMPLAEAFSKHVRIIGFDINNEKVQKLKREYSSLELTSNPAKIKEADVVIIAVPTPVKKTKEPDLEPVESASRIVGKNIKKGSIVVLESTVYPGVTEDILGHILEMESGFILGQDFKIGYSPERVNPGDKEHTIDKITKIVSGMDEESTNTLSELYGTITTVYKTKDIKTAEAAKVIENIQRDLNIALINEFSIIFQKIGLNTKDVLDAASTKWNFIRFNPGMVGGHCIPVDPYYLVYRAKEVGYYPQVILAGRSINDFMPKHIALITIKAMNEAKKVINGSSILIMGLTFKENVEDIRETPVIELIKDLKEFNCKIYGYDPLLNKENIESFGIIPIDSLMNKKFDGVIITVIHDIFKKIKLEEFKKIMNGKGVLIDVRGALQGEKELNDFIYKTL